MTKIKVKTKEEIEKMAEGGKKLARVKNKLKKSVKRGVSALDIEKRADELIKAEGGKASFKMVPGYSWATCVNVNDGIVHGIPKKEVMFKDGDLVSVDVGMYYKGFHTDTSFSVGLSLDSEKKKFLKAGEVALGKAIGSAKEGNRIHNISEAIQRSIEEVGYSPIRALVGHGIGRELHEEPKIPCFVDGNPGKGPIIPEGAVMAIEVMYARGGYNVMLDSDGWTIKTRDGTITALFEETVAVTNKGPIILTTLQ